MISKADIEQLLQRKAIPDSPVLSVYLDIDQSKASNLNRGFEISLEDMFHAIEAQLDEKQLRSFAADAERTRHFVSGLEPRGKGLIIFCDDSENFFWPREIKTSVRNNARWDETPYLVPLLEVLDEYERYGLVLVDKARARLFTVFIGEIEEHHDAFAPAEVSRTKTAGTDHIRSEKRFQDKADMHVHWHLKHVAQALDKVIDDYGFDRLVLAGPVEATSELYDLLSKRARTRFCGRISLPFEVGDHEILEEALKLERQLEREMEEKLVEALVNGDGHQPTTLGLERTLQALAEGRIWHLVYRAGFSIRGGSCSNCSMLLARTEGSCDYCGARLKPINDLLERMVERVLEQDGKVEEVAGDAAVRLERSGGIGAFLRF